MVAAIATTKAENLAAYIKFALPLITINGDEAFAPSQGIQGMGYTVGIENNRAVSCNCADARYRKHECKHQKVVTKKLNPRRSAPNVELIASLQVPEGAKIRKIRGFKAIAPVLVYFEVGGVKVSAPTAAQALLKALKLVKVAPQVSSACPEVGYHVGGDIDVTAFADEDELPELPEEVEALDFNEDEEFSVEIEQIWTEQEIAMIRQAAVISVPKVQATVPQATKVDYSQRGALTRNCGFSFMRR